MKPKNRKDSDDLLEILKAYRFPTIIMSIGLVIAIFGFQLALRYDMSQSERSFQEISEQVYRTLDTEIRRHEQLVNSISRILGQIRDISKEEFSDISGVFTDTTYFTHFYLYTYVADNGASQPSSITEFFYSAEASPGAAGSAASAAVLPEIRTVVERARSLGKAYVSNPYEIMSDGNKLMLATVVAPVAERHMKNLFLVGVIDLGQLFKDSLKTENETINARIYNVVNLDENLIYEQIEAESREFFKTANEKHQSLLSFQRTRFFDDHQWNIVLFSSMRRLIGYVGLFPWITFLSVISVTGLLSYIVFRITTESLKASAMVEAQTKSLREYAQRLEMSNRDLDDFAHIASHDLKEPLRGIYNYAEFLREDYYEKFDKDGRQKLDTLKTLARRMESLISSLLEYSRLSRIDLAFQKTDLGRVVTDVLETLEPWLEENKGKVTVAADLPEIVCDPVRIAEVFRNLITNAVKYNNKPLKSVEIGWIDDYEGFKDVPVFYVQDDGIGVAEEHKEQIFKIFKRLHGRDEYGGGTGAGLTIVWKIVERHGGKIWVKSRPHEGTTFYFTLKRKPDVSQQNA